MMNADKVREAIVQKQEDEKYFIQQSKGIIISQIQQHMKNIELFVDRMIESDGKPFDYVIKAPLELISISRGLHTTICEGVVEELKRYGFTTKTTESIVSLSNGEIPNFVITVSL